MPATPRLVRRSIRSSRPKARALFRAVAAVAALAIVATACGDDSVPTIELSQDNNDLSPAVDDVQSGGAPDGEFAHLSYDLFDGGTSRLGTYEGTPLVVNFFAAWCPSCISEMPDFQSAFESLDGEVAFLGLSQDELATDALDLIAETGITYDVGWDPDLEVYLAFGGLAMPTTVFIDAEGQAMEVFAGALNEEALLERIERIRT